LAIEQLFRTSNPGINFDASYVSDRTSQKAWLFLNPLSAMITMEYIADIARIGKDKNASFKDLQQIHGWITAGQVVGE
jgi:hypothetical protein